MTTNDYLAIAVTTVGGILCFIFMAFMFWGTRIPGDDGKPQIIKYQGIELQTNSIVMVLLISAIITVLPFGLNSYFQVRTKTIVPDPEAVDLFLTGRVEDENGAAVEGAVARVTEMGLNGTTKVLFSKNIESDGNFEFPVHVKGNDRIKIETDKPNYRKQSVIIQLKGVQFHPVLVRKGN